MSFCRIDLFTTCIIRAFVVVAFALAKMFNQSFTLDRFYVEYFTNIKQITRWLVKLHKEGNIFVPSTKLFVVCFCFGTVKS